MLGTEVHQDSGPTGGAVTDTRASDIEFPDMEPPDTSTHLHGYFAPTRYDSNAKWTMYDAPLTYETVPSNLKWVESHWTN